jgi:uncharacterized membrane protein
MNINITLSLDSAVLPALADFLKSHSDDVTVESKSVKRSKPEAEAEAKPKKKRGRPRKNPEQSMATPEAKAEVAAEAAKQTPRMTRDELRELIAQALDQLGDEPVRAVFQQVGVTKFSEIKDEAVNPIADSLQAQLG